MKTKEDEMYFNPRKYLPYQRNFILVNSERVIGKTYSTQKFMLERALERKERFLYIVRTQEEIKKGVFQDAFMKVMYEQFPEVNFIFKRDKCYYRPNPEIKDMDVFIGQCLSLSEANKTKRINYPRIKWGLFDEYILEEKRRSEYVNGWEEPTLLLKLYETVDRDQDYLTIFMMANTVEFYNPYHLHQAFKVPPIKKNEIWKGDNVLYTIAEGSAALKEKKKSSKFLKMIEGTEYGKYAKDGYFINDNTAFIENRPFGCSLKFNFDVNGSTFGVWLDHATSRIYIDSVHDPNFKIWFTFNSEKHIEGKTLIKGKEAFLCKWLGTEYKKGHVYWTSMEVKGKSMDGLVKMM